MKIENNNGVDIPKQININGTVSEGMTAKVLDPYISLEGTLSRLGGGREVNLVWVERMVSEGYLTEAAMTRIKQNLKVIMFGLIEESVSQEKTNQREVESSIRESRLKREKAEEDGLANLKKYLLPTEAAIMAATCGHSAGKERKYMVTLYKELGIMNEEGDWIVRGIEKREGELEEILGGHEAVNLVEVKDK